MEVLMEKSFLIKSIILGLIPNFLLPIPFIEEEVKEEKS
jgi:hypothetical protein